MNPIAKDEVLKNLDGVVTVMKSGGQYQVVIGNAVADVYAQVLPLLHLGDMDNMATQSDGKKEKLLDRFVDIISGIFSQSLVSWLPVV